MDALIINSSEYRSSSTKTFEGRWHCLENRISLRRVRHHGISACQTNLQGSRNLPSPTSNILPRSKAKCVFLARLPSSARGWTPLHCAASEGHDATVERLRAAGADVNAVDNDRRGLGAGRIDPDSTQICWNFASEHQHFRV